MPTAKTPIDKTGEKPGETRPAQTLASGPLTITARNEDGTTAWVINATNSKATLAEQGASVGELTGVTGQLYSKGVVASNFTAQKAKANQASRRVDASGEVRITDESRKTVLSASEMVWDETQTFVVAKGSVTVRSDVYVLGPFPELWATPDLKRFGTPDELKP